ncbi:unnamed protein product [Penicillium pancosmium]
MTDFTEANRKYFDQMATNYKDRFASAMKTLSDQTLEHRLWLSDRWTDTEAGQDNEVKMLEYACGPGVISMTLAPYLSKVVGIDVSDNMIDEFNRNAQLIDIADKMVGYKADLLSDSVPAKFSGPDFTEFDMVTVSMALHHFEYPQMALQRLGSRLNKDGVCMIIDILSRSGHDHGHGDGHGHGHGHGEEKHGHNFGDAAHTVKTHGFSQEDMQKLFEGAGLGRGFKYEVIPEELVFNKGEKTHNVTVFIARAQRS